jgi:hypothetical protein
VAAKRDLLSWLGSDRCILEAIVKTTAVFCSALILLPFYGYGQAAKPTDIQTVSVFDLAGKPSDIQIVGGFLDFCGPEPNETSKPPSSVCGAAAIHREFVTDHV